MSEQKSGVLRQEHDRRARMTVPELEGEDWQFARHHGQPDREAHRRAFYARRNYRPEEGTP